MVLAESKTCGKVVVKSAAENYSPVSPSSFDLINNTELYNKFHVFSRFGMRKKNREGLSMSNLEKWLKQARIITPDTSSEMVLTFKHMLRTKRFLAVEEFPQFLKHLAAQKRMSLKELSEKLVACGSPRHTKITDMFHLNQTKSETDICRSWLKRESNDVDEKEVRTKKIDCAIVTRDDKDENTVKVNFTSRSVDGKDDIPVKNSVKISSVKSCVNIVSNRKPILKNFHSPSESGLNLKRRNSCFMINKCQEERCLEARNYGTSCVKKTSSPNPRIPMQTIQSDLRCGSSTRLVKKIRNSQNDKNCNRCNSESEVRKLNIKCTTTYAVNKPNIMKTNKNHDQHIRNETKPKRFITSSTNRRKQTYSKESKLTSRQNGKNTTESKELFVDLLPKLEETQLLQDNADKAETEDREPNSTEIQPNERCENEARKDHSQSKPKSATKNEAKNINPLEASFDQKSFTVKKVKSEGRKEKLLLQKKTSHNQNNAHKEGAKSEESFKLSSHRPTPRLRRLYPTEPHQSSELSTLLNPRLRPRPVPRPRVQIEANSEIGENLQKLNSMSSKCDAEIWNEEILDRAKPNREKTLTVEGLLQSPEKYKLEVSDGSITMNHELNLNCTSSESRLVKDISPEQRRAKKANLRVQFAEPVQYYWI